MKKLLLLLSLFLTLQVSGQILPGVVASQSIVASPPVGNMISNGTFDSATGWSAVSGWAITGGAAVLTTGGGNADLVQTDANMQSSIVANTSYTLTFDLTMASGNARLALTDADNSILYLAFANYPYSDTTVEMTFTTPGSVGNAGIDIVSDAGNTVTFSIDNVVLVAN